MLKRAKEKTYHATPIFPYFKNVYEEDRKYIDAFVSKFPPYSDFVFSNILNWSKKEHENKYTFFNGNLIVQTRDNKGEEMVTTMLGDNKIDETVETLLKEVEKIQYVPEIVIEKISNKNVKVKEDRDNFDYIYKVDDVINMDGREYSRRRRDLRHFKVQNSNYKTKNLDLSMPNIQKEIIELYKTWLKTKKTVLESYKIELHSLQQYLKNYTHNKNKKNIGVYINDKLVGIAINEIVSHNHSIIYYIKGDKTYNGITTYLFHKSAKVLKKSGVKIINYDVDLGLDNLREAKQSMRPFCYLKKYIINIPE